VIHAWNEELKAMADLAYRKLVEGQNSVTPALRDIAIRAKGLPVYCDMGGCLVITMDGLVMHYDSDTGVCIEVHDPKWITLALVACSEKYAELKALKPPKPDDSDVCMACNGTGKLLPNSRIRCGTCAGTGWVDSIGLEENR
jgi:hypothetical protein